MTEDDFRQAMAARKARQDAVRPAFEALLPFHHLTIPSWSSKARPATAYELLVEEATAIRGRQYATGDYTDRGELEAAAVRICADQFATEIEAAAGDAGQQPDTIGWITARLRGPDQPPAVLRRVTEGFATIREWRDANNQRMQTDELEKIAVRLCADQLARDVEDTAFNAGQNIATTAWVLAGLRCPSRPFCPGCPDCFTITAPHRPNERRPA